MAEREPALVQLALQALPDDPALDLDPEVLLVQDADLPHPLQVEDDAALRRARRPGDRRAGAEGHDRDLQALRELEDAGDLLGGRLHDAARRSGDSAAPHPEQVAGPCVTAVGQPVCVERGDALGADDPGEIDDERGVGWRTRQERHGRGQGSGRSGWNQTSSVGGSCRAPRALPLARPCGPCSVPGVDSA